MTQRERIIAAGLAAVVVLYGADRLIEPYFAERQRLAAAIQKADLQQKHDTQLLADRAKVDSDWKKLTASTLETQSAQASSKINNALFDWANLTRFKLVALKPDRPSQKGDFQQIRFQVSGEGSTASAAAFLLAVETTDLPLRIDDLRMSSRKEGVNDLAVQLTVTTIVFSPPSTTKPAKTAQAQGDAL